MSSPLSDILYTPTHQVDVSWSLDPQKGNMTTTLSQRHDYLRLWTQLEAVDGTPTEPADPFVGVEDFPASPLFTVEEVFNGLPGSEADFPDLLNALLDLSAKGAVVPEAPEEGFTTSGFLTPGMIQAIDALMVSLRMSGYITNITSARFEPGPPGDPPAYFPPEVEITTGDTAAALQVWRDLPQTPDVVAEGIQQGAEARIRFLKESDQFATTSLQHLIRFEYVQRGNEIMFDSMQELHDGLSLVEETMGLLNRVGDILNNKDPESAKLDLEALVRIHRDRFGVSVDTTNDITGGRNKDRYIADLDQWEKDQFDRSLETEVRGFGREDSGFIGTYNTQFGLTPAVVTIGDAAASPSPDPDGQIVGPFVGQLVAPSGDPLTDIGEEIIPGSVEITNGFETYVDDGNGILILKGNDSVTAGNIDYVNGDYDITFLRAPRTNETIEAQAQIARTFEVRSRQVAVGNGVSSFFEGELGVFPIEAGTFQLFDGRETFIPDPPVAPGSPAIANRQLKGSQSGQLLGEINELTGKWEVTFNSPPFSGSSIRVHYDHKQIPVNGRVVGTGDGLTTAFTGILAPNPLSAGSVVITDGRQTFKQKLGDNNLYDENDNIVGDVDPLTGAFNIDIIPAPANFAEIQASFTHNNPGRFLIDDEPLTNLVVENIGSTGKQASGSVTQIPIVPGSVDIDIFVEVDRFGIENLTLKILDDGNGNLIINPTTGQSKKDSFDVSGTVNYSDGTYSIQILPTGPADEILNITDDTGIKYQLFNGVPDNDATLLYHIQEQMNALVDKLEANPVTAGSDISEKVQLVRDDLLGIGFIGEEDSEGVPAPFSIEEYIRDFKKGADGDEIQGEYQKNLNAAVVAAQSTNDSQKEELRRRMFEFEEFYKSASAVMQKIHQILERLAQGISKA